MDFCHYFDRYEVDEKIEKEVAGRVTDHAINLFYFWNCQLMVISASLTALIIIIFTIFLVHQRRSRKSSFHSRFEHLNLSFMSLVKNSLADYISEKTWIKVSFFILGIIFYTFGWIIVSIGFAFNARFLKYKQFDDDELYFTLFLLFVERVMQLFLLSMIGSKQETLLYAVHPGRINNTPDERRFIVQLQFVRTVIITALFNCLPMVMNIPDIHRTSDRDFVPPKLQFLEYIPKVMFLYFCAERAAFIFHEKHILELVATQNKVVSKAQAIDRFMKEYGPAVLIHKLEGDKNKGAETLEEIDGLLKPRFEILKSQLELLKSDTSIPIAVNSGDILILQKFYWWVVFLSYLFTCTGILGYFIDWFDLWYAYGNILSDVLEIVVHPFAALPLFCSKIIFGSRLPVRVASLEHSVSSMHDFEMT